MRGALSRVNQAGATPRGNAELQQTRSRPRGPQRRGVDGQSQLWKFPTVRGRLFFFKKQGTQELRTGAACRGGAGFHWLSCAPAAPARLGSARLGGSRRRSGKTWGPRPFQAGSGI